MDSEMAARRIGCKVRRDEKSKCMCEGMTNVIIVCADFTLTSGTERIVLCPKI